MNRKFLDFNLRNLSRRNRELGSDIDAGTVVEDQRVGLKPQKGWAKRNCQFIGSRLVPTILKQRERSFIGRPVYADLEHHEIEVTWIGHASFLIRTPELNIMIDPNWAMWHGPVKRARHPGMALMDLPRIDLVLVTHAHFDHLHRPSLKKIAKGQPILVPTGVGRLMKRMNFSVVREMNNWDTFRVGDTEIVFTPAYHWGARMIHDTHRGFGGFLINTPHASLYHSGDSAYFEGFGDIGERYDIGTALLPIGAYEAPSGRDVHMNPEEALQAFADLKADRMIPMHHATFPLGNESMCEPMRRLNLAAIAQNVHHQVLAPREGEQLVVAH